MPSSFQWNSLTNKKKKPRAFCAKSIHASHACKCTLASLQLNDDPHMKAMHRSNQPRIRCEKNKNKNKKIETKWKRNKSKCKINNGAAGQKVNMVDFVSEMMPPILTIHDATPYSSITTLAASISCVDHRSGSVCVERTRTHTHRPYGRIRYTYIVVSYRWKRRTETTILPKINILPNRVAWWWCRVDRSKFACFLPTLPHNMMPNNTFTDLDHVDVCACVPVCAMLRWDEICAVGSTFS